MIKVALHPTYDSRMLLNDLEQELTVTNFLEIMPTALGARKDFYRVMRNLEESHDVKFVVVKETKRDVVWNVIRDPRTNLGSYMVTLGDRSRQDPRPTWVGSKSKRVHKGRMAEDRAYMDEICDVLDEALNGAHVNSFTFHRIVLKWLRQHAALVTDRPSGNGKQKDMKSSYYYMDDSYKAQLDVIADLYTKFNMSVTLKLVEDEG